MKTYQALAKYLEAYQNCQRNYREEWKEKWEKKIEEIMKTAPHGSGIDTGITFDIEKSTPDKLVFYFSFHHMNECGFYTNWTDHKAIVTPSFTGDYYLQITGRNQNDIKDYLADIFYTWLDEEITEEK